MLLKNKLKNLRLGGLSSCCQLRRSSTLFFMCSRLKRDDFLEEFRFFCLHFEDLRVKLTSGPGVISIVTWPTLDAKVSNTSHRINGSELTCRGCPQMERHLRDCVFRKRGPPGHRWKTIQTKLRFYGRWLGCKPNWTSSLSIRAGWPNIKFYFPSLYSYLQIVYT